MAYEMVMPYHLHMPSYFLETFTEYPKKGVTFYRNSLTLIRRGSGIRTHDPLLPKQVR